MQCNVRRDGISQEYVLLFFF